MLQHYDLNNKNAYEAWRSIKLKPYPLHPNELFITLDESLNPETLHELRIACATYNVALYRFNHPQAITKSTIHDLAHQLGLKRIHTNLCAGEDGLSAITITQHPDQHDYIPYTDKALSWHTDGYYHAAQETIQGMLLHCVQPALQGGETCWMDHELAYIALRDANPQYIQALMHPEALTIPANRLNGVEIRAESVGPVFSFNQAGHLHMRYSSRQRNIHWREDHLTQQAVAFLAHYWEQQDSPFIVRHTLQAGEGLICNNVLHNRNRFVDSEEVGKQRLLYRGRYLDRVGFGFAQPTCFGFD